ncbi:hypothetical protein H7J88_26880 [Mycolicibacterium flavescens]|uniref:Uncharacterized protein n=1 Tax=Mycolicibacterium flavescens TaxID=1776 RepID=A0A1E3RPI1_MYCFV|nr:hypothetical protein [Mycolicibacterium flavescens]MCV7283266.1 hypothetical protein [Mycolicibacterium flavescens]ODQ91816.1 hypothetical protein BHQ18_02845 [Mycolicibacterium flavescens]
MTGRKFAGGPYGNRVQESAREWQSLQLAVLGFVGLCGVLSGDVSGRTRPNWLQEAGAMAAFAGFAMAVAAILLVATVAHPVITQPRTSAAAISRLRVGIALTFAAAALTAVAALTWWWPQPGSPAPSAPRIEVTTSQGSVCGSPVPGRSDAVALEADGEQIVIPLRRLLALDVVESC